MKLEIGGRSRLLVTGALAIAVLTSGGRQAPGAASALQVDEPAPQCPAVRVSCPDSIEEESEITFTASVSGGQTNVTPTFSWTISSGSIASGQGTSSISVATLGLGGQTVTGTVDVLGYSPQCRPSESCTAAVALAAAPSAKFGEYVTRDLAASKADLDRWLLALERDPTAQGYLIAYGGRVSAPDDAQTAADNATDYTINTRKMEGARTLSGVGGYRELPTIELWIAPGGGKPPRATPTVEAKDVTPTR